MRRETEHSFSSSASAPLAPSQPRATRGERIVIWIVSGLVVAGLVLGVSKHGQPLSPRARELFIPGSVMLLLLIGWPATRRGPDRSTLWFGAIIATFALLRAAVVGPGSAFFVHMQRQRRRDRPRSAAATRAWLVFGAVLTGFAGGLAVAAALPSGPSVGVDLRAVAYGGDPSAGVLPSAFGLAVKDAHCSHAATAYTVAIAGRSFSVRCSATAGGAVHTLTLGLTAGHSYPVTIRPIEIRPGRGPRMGRSQRLTVSIPSADSKAWQTFP